MHWQFHPRTTLSSYRTCPFPKNTQPQVCKELLRTHPISTFIRIGSSADSFNFLDRSRVDFLKKLGTWTFTSAEELERSENRIRSFAACKTTQEFITTRLHNPGVEDVEISMNTVTCGDFSKDKPTLGTWIRSYSVVKFRLLMNRLTHIRTRC